MLDQIQTKGTAKALVIYPDIRERGPRQPQDHPHNGGPDRSKAATRAPESRLAEAVGLAAAIDLDVVDAQILRLPRIVPATLIGPGQIEQVRDTVEALAVGLVVIDHPVTPVQQRNLERALKAKVIDRTGLILDIFGARARTKEGSLQVELAALSYQRSRLVRSWTHLERQRGGYGFLGGPGESQLEIDRRIITDRIAQIRRALDRVKRTRGLHRESRAKVPYPIVALVGYTNAGKSTLFNRLTESNVHAKDLLFATLDPTLRQVDLPSGRRVILSDTVGFISDLPTSLIAAFRATLEEVLSADLIIHVRDVSHLDSAAQKTDVLEVLEELGIGGEGRDIPLLEAQNKIDLLSRDQRKALEARSHDAAKVSAVNGDGIPDLLQRIDQVLGATRETVRLSVDLSDGSALAFLYRHGEVIEREDDESCAYLTARLDPEDLARFTHRYAGTADAVA